MLIVREGKAFYKEKRRERNKKILACARNRMQERKRKKKREEKNKSGKVYIVYVGVAQSLVATNCYYM